MISAILSFYLQGLVISAVIVIVLAALYLMTYLIRHNKTPRKIVRNRIFDVILIAILTIPILSFAIVALLVIFGARNL